MGKLLEQLEAYQKLGVYPFHMPGHKRQTEGVTPFFAPWFERDVTEIPGLDDLHAPEGILKEAQERAAELYGAKQSFFLVNGSTAGVMAAISATVKKGGTILMQRASHRSAYHAVQLRELRVCYLYGRQAVMQASSHAEEAAFQNRGNGHNVPCETVSIGLGVSIDEVRDAVEAHPGIEAVFLTSPSYDGFSADLAAIADFLHTREIPLIVDAAHGAHLGFSESFPGSALQCGADVVVMSVHKTLPAPTQTALLHLGSERIPAERLQRFLSIYQTSSPSYLLMAAIDECVERVSGWGDVPDGKTAQTCETVWQKFLARRKGLSERLHSLKQFGIWDAFGRSHVPGLPDICADRIPQTDMPELGKLLVFPPDGKSGVALGERLAEEGIQCEMALPAYVLLICTVMDTEAGYEKLAEVLEKLDGEYGKERDKLTIPENLSNADAQTRREKEKILCSVICEDPVTENLTIADAAELSAEKIPLSKANGRISAAYVSVYPPGQPLLVPGEMITKEIIEQVERLYLEQAALQGLCFIQ